MGGKEMLNEEKMTIVKMIDERFGELVKVMKKERGYSLHEISDRTNLSPSYIYRVIRGYRFALLETKLNILLNCFQMEEEVELYLMMVIKNKESLKKITE
jgi:predicted transcriptional regulator